MNSLELDKLVKNIVKSRKIQKDRIESNQESLFEENSNIQKMQKPVVDAISESAKKTIQSLENQRENIAGMMSAIEYKLDERKDPHWLQKFYQQHRTKAGLTKMEVDLNGNLGNHGHVDIQLLFNKGRIKIKYGNKRSFEIANNRVTLGFVGLLMLPYEDLKEAKENHPFEITLEDIDLYAEIMVKCGIKGSKTSKKYNVFVRDYDAKYDSEGEDVKLTPIQQQRELFQQRRDDELNRVRFGTGVFHYQNGEDLEKRLDLLMGSLMAGNNSNVVREEIRAILDKLLEIEYIPYTIHRKFYQKFNL